ncbi:DUF2185 domain-containing protein [Bacteroidota bacterium]
MASNKYKINSEDIKDLINPMGYGLISDRITVDGERVGYMYRDRPEEKEDSGWRFIAGDETQDYIDDEKNSMMFDLNTIANYDQAIIPYLVLPVGSELERVPGKDEFQKL